MADKTDAETVREVGTRTGRDPVVLAAVGSVLLSWYQFYVRGNQTHGLFIGLWPPTLLAFSNAVRIRALGEKVETSAGDLVGRLVKSR